MSTEQPSSSSFKPAPGVVVAGKVRLERLLARGGMGSVWVAKHIGLDISVAVKFMTNSTEQSVSRFRREARLTAKLKSTNIVTILDYGVDQDTPYIVMELLDGENLGTRLKRVGHVSLIEAERIIVPIARALERAHEAHLVHRDLKPDNIFIAREGDEEVPKILDFGIVKSLSSTSRSSREETEDGAVIGTLHYMSPEQARGLPDIDHRADIWSIGVILYRMLTGKRPFNATGFGQIIMQICSDPHLHASSILPSLPKEIDSFFDRALAKNPADRFSSMKEMAQAYTAIVKKHRTNEDVLPTHFPTLTTLDSSDAPTLVRPPAAAPPPAPPLEPPPPVAPTITATATISTTVDPVMQGQTGSHHPSRTGAMVGMTVIIVAAVALGLVVMLWITSTTSENTAQDEASTNSAVVPATTVLTPPLPSTSTVAAASSSSAPAPAATTSPPTKSIKTKQVDSTKKKKRDFGY